MNCCKPSPTHSDIPPFALQWVVLGVFCSGICLPHRPELISQRNLDAAGAAENAAQSKGYISDTTVPQEDMVCGVMYIHSRRMRTVAQHESKLLS
jgi:hypothetical protein